MSLNLHPEPTSSAKSKSYKKALRVGGAISLVGVGSTFAANISLNNDANVEFGQGVAQTAACDSDGFFVNPVSYYDNTSSTFRLDYVEVTGLNLIPVGAISGSYDASSHTYSYSDSTSIAAHPGQYYDTATSAWANTCDQVVLDFKAYTDQTKYSTNTLDGYDAVYSDNSATPNTISSPLFWTTDGNTSNPGVTTPYYQGGGNGNWGYNTDVAVVFGLRGGDVQDYNLFTDARYDSNYANIGVESVVRNGEDYYDVSGVSITSPGDNGGTGFVKESSFRFFANNSHQYHFLERGSNDGYDPIAGAISKITVESLKYFPSGYQLKYDFSGALGIKPSS